MSINPDQLADDELHALEDRYRQMAAISSEPDEFRSDAQEVRNVIPFPSALERQLRHFRGRFEALGAIDDPNVGDVLTLVFRDHDISSRMKQRFMAAARDKVAARDREAFDSGEDMAWADSLGRLGNFFRHTKRLYEEGGLFNVIRGETGSRRWAWMNPSRAEQRVLHQAEQDWTKIVQCSSFEELIQLDQSNDPPTEYAQWLAEEIGLLAPNAMAFDLKRLTDWADEQKIGDEPSAGEDSRSSVRQLLGKIMSNEELASQKGKAILSHLKTQPNALDELNAICERRLGKDVESAKEEFKRLENILKYEKRRRATELQSIEKLKKCADLLTEIQAQESNRLDLKGKISLYKKKLKALAPLEDGTDYHARERASMGQTLSQAEFDLKKAESQIKLLWKRYETRFSDPIEGGVETQYAAIAANNLKGITEQIQRLEVSILHVRENLYESKKSELEERNERGYDYDQISDVHPDIKALNIESFADLEERFQAAQTAYREAARSSRTSPKLNASQVLFLLMKERHSKNESATTEETIHRSVIDTLLLPDLVDSDVDEFIALRRIQQYSRKSLLRFLDPRTYNPLKLFKWRDKDLTLDEVISQDRDLRKKAKIHPKSTAKEIMEAFHAEKITMEKIATTIRMLERLLTGYSVDRVTLELGDRDSNETYALLNQFKLAYYRLKIREQITPKLESASRDQHAQVVMDFLASNDLVIPPPRLGEEPHELETRSEHHLKETVRGLKEKLEGLDPNSEVAQQIQKHLSFLERFKTEFLAEGLFFIAGQLPYWFNNRSNWWTNWRNRRRNRSAQRKRQKFRMPRGGQSSAA